MPPGSTAGDEVLFCRLYWLLTVAPHVDSERKPVDWLAAGMARNTSTPRLMSLYFQELNRRPEEALRERSRKLLTQPRPTWQLADLAREHRWRFHRILDRLEEIAVDQRLLSGPFISAHEEWAQLLMAAVEVLVWSNGEDVAIQLGECLREFELMTDVQLGLAGPLDRHELLLVIAADYRQYKDAFYPDFPRGLVQLLPELWLGSGLRRLRARGNPGSVGRPSGDCAWMDLKACTRRAVSP